MQTTPKNFGLPSFSAAMLLVSGLSIPAAAQNSPSAGHWSHGQKTAGSIPAGQTVLTFVNRLLINPPQVVVYGYFVDIAGVPGPLFSGTPSNEATAHFTWSLNAAGAVQLQNGAAKDPGSIGVAVLPSNESFNIYYNANPNQSWSNPASFAAGQLIASFKSTPGTQTGAGPVSFVTQSYTRVSSQDFTFKGETYNLERVIRHGFTLFGVASQIPLDGALAPPLTFSAAGSAVAIGGSLSGVPDGH